MRAAAGARPFRHGGGTGKLLASASRTGNLLAVAIDDGKALLAMTGHLLSVGHRRIGFVTGGQAQSAAARRREGYYRMPRETGLPRDNRR